MMVSWRLNGRPWTEPVLVQVPQDVLLDDVVPLAASMSGVELPPLDEEDSSRSLCDKAEDGPFSGTPCVTALFVAGQGRIRFKAVYGSHSASS